MAGIVERIQRLMAWFQGTRVGRMNARYGAVRAGQLAGGIAYAALFSVFAALTIAFTVVMRIIGNNDELRQAVLDSLNQSLPGIVDTGDGSGGVVSPDDLIMNSGLTWTSAIASGALLFSALAVMGAISSSLRAVFGLVAPPGNFVIAKLRDLLGFVLLATSVILTAVLGIGAGAAGSWVTSLLGLDSYLSGLLVRGLGILGAYGVDVIVFASLMRVVGGARPPRRDLWQGAMLGAVGSGAIRLLGTTLVGGASSNALLGAAVAVVTLLLWVNLVSRLMLYVAAWTANPPSPVVPDVNIEDLHVRQQPNYVTLSAPHTLTWDHDAHTGLVQLSEASRVEREAAEAAEAARLTEVEAALGAALEKPEGWLGRRRRLRRARAAVREVRADDTA